MANPLASMQLL